MNIETFIKECNRSPLIKKHGKITEEILENIDFKLDSYSISDIPNLEKILYFIPPIVIKNNEPEYVRLNRTEKDMYHANLIELFDNKRFVKKLRRELKMPFDNKGFDVLKRIMLYEKSLTNTNFEFLSPDYKKWFFSWTKDIDFRDEFDRWKDTTPIVFKAIDRVIIKALKKWDLPWRYYDAIGELIIFNTIIPAHPGIVFHQEFNSSPFKRSRISIEFDIDTTKEELIKAIKDYPHKSFKKFKSDLIGKPRRNQRSSEATKQMIAIYNKHKKDGKKDKDIFTMIKNDPAFQHLSLSAIRNRIKKK